MKCKCGARISVQRSQAGSRIECPQCRQSLEIPTIRGFSALEIEDTPIASQPFNSLKLRRWTPVRGTMTAICFIIALVGLGRSGLYGCYRLSNPTNFSESELIREAEQLASECTPVVAWDTWRYLQETGLGSKNPPEVLVAKRYLEKQDTIIVRWAIAGALGLLGLVACNYWPGSKSS